MINFSTSFSSNPLANLKPRVKGVDDINSKANSNRGANSTNSATANSSRNSTTINSSANIDLSISANSNSQISSSNSTNQFLVTDKSQAVGTSLGYGIDKDGYYTSDFNEAAGIPNDYKIHSSTMESFARIQENMQRYENFISVDIAKAVGSAYKILSQVVDESILNSKDSFSKDDIAQFPKGYEFVRENFEVLNVYKTDNELDRVAQRYDYRIGSERVLFDLFKPQPEMRNIFDNLNGGREGELGGVHWATTADKYTNKDGTITKGGLLIGIMNHNTVIAQNAITTETPEDSPYVIGRIKDGVFYPNDKAKANKLEEENYKSPIMQLLEEIIARLKEQTQKAVQKRLDNADKANSAQNSQKVDIKA